MYCKGSIVNSGPSGRIADKEDALYPSSRLKLELQGFQSSTEPSGTLMAQCHG